MRGVTNDLVRKAENELIEKRNLAGWKPAEVTDFMKNREGNMHAEFFDLKNDVRVTFEILSMRYDGGIRLEGPDGKWYRMSERSNSWITFIGMDYEDWTDFAVVMFPTDGYKRLSWEEARRNLIPEREPPAAKEVVVTVRPPNEGVLISNWGEVRFDINDGHIIGYSLDVTEFGSPPRLIDVKEWKRYYPNEHDILANEHDILDFGMWLEDGTYREASKEWREERKKGLKHEH